MGFRSVAFAVTLALASLRAGRPSVPDLVAVLCSTAVVAAQVVSGSMHGTVSADPERIEQASVDVWFDAGALRVTGKGEPGADVPSVQENMLAGAVEAFRQGSTGLASEMRLLFSRPWGFEPANMTVPAYLWYGDDDRLVPPAVGRYLESVLPNASLTVCPSEGHLLYHTHWEEILKTLAPQP